MNVASLNCKMLKQVLQYLQSKEFEENPEVLAEGFSKLICELNEITSNPIDRLRGLKQIKVYVKYTKKTVPAKSQMQTDLLIALLDIEIEMCVFMFNNNLPVMQAADEILPVFHWTDQKSDLVELVRGVFEKGSVDRGKAQLKELMRGIGILFRVDLSNHANIFLSIRNRKGERAEYLKQIYDSLTDKMDEMDK
ncbi:MAG: RteC domain-containing protein [Alistipes onderdonkii]|jgi:hypothetical protein